MADYNKTEAKIVSQLSRDLTPEMLEHESIMLGRVSFPLKQKQVASMAAQFSLGNADGDNFTALDWYAQEPAEEDNLYKIVQQLYHEVRQTLDQLSGENRFEIKPNAGPSTQYALLFSDDERNRLTIDEVLAFYLIDIAERCKKSPPLQAGGITSAAGEDTSNTTQTAGSKSGAAGGKNSAASKQAARDSGAAGAEGVTLERNNYHFYMTVCVFVQLYRSCLNDTIQATFGGNFAQG